MSSLIKISDLKQLLNENKITVSTKVDSSEMKTKFNVVLKDETGGDMEKLMPVILLKATINDCSDYKGNGLFALWYTLSQEDAQVMTDLETVLYEAMKTKNAASLKKQFKDMNKADAFYKDMVKTDAEGKYPPSMRAKIFTCSNPTECATKKWPVGCAPFMKITRADGTVVTHPVPQEYLCKKGSEVVLAITVKNLYVCQPGWGIDVFLNEVLMITEASASTSTMINPMDFVTDFKPQTLTLSGSEKKLFTALLREMGYAKTRRFAKEAGVTEDRLVEFVEEWKVDRDQMTTMIDASMMQDMLADVEREEAAAEAATSAVGGVNGGYISD